MNVRKVNLKGLYESLLLKPKTSYSLVSNKICEGSTFSGIVFFF